MLDFCQRIEQQYKTCHQGWKSTMKRTNQWIVPFLLALVILACNAGAVQTVEVTRVVPQTIVVTEAAPEGGFSAGTPVDVSGLPVLMQIPGGGAAASCFAETAQAPIGWGYGIFPYESLCLNNFPVADGMGFTVTVTDAAGHTFSETFTHSQGSILNSTGTPAGWSESEIDPTSAAIGVYVYLPASFSCGDWSVSAQAQDGSITVGPATLAMDCSRPRLSVLSDLSINPFRSPEHGFKGPTFANGQTFHVIGTAYPPDTAITIALYQEDPSAGKSETGYPLGTAKDAVSVMTDHAGNFQVSFIIGNGTLKGLYWAIAAPTITPDMRLDPFGTKFSIE